MTAGSVRMSNSELAAINAAAVTKEYRVQPHLGLLLPLRHYNWLIRLVQTTAQYQLLMGE